MIAPSSRDDLKEIGKAVLIATVSALTAGLVQWGIDALRDRLRNGDDEDEEHRL